MSRRIPRVHAQSVLLTSEKGTNSDLLIGHMKCWVSITSLLRKPPDRRMLRETGGLPLTTDAADAAKRRFPRYRISLPLLHRPKAPTALNVGVGWSRDLSEGGACVELAERLRPQRPVRIQIQTDAGPIKAEARVVWRQDPASAEAGILHGVAFTHIAEDQLQVLRDVIYRKGERGDAGIRLPLEVSVTCQPLGQEEPPIAGWTGDVGRGGLLLRLLTSLAPGTALDLTLHTPHGPLTAQGVVVWVAPPDRRPAEGPVPHGLRFTTLGWSTMLSLGLLLADPV